MTPLPTSRAPIAHPDTALLPLLGDHWDPARQYLEPHNGTQCPQPGGGQPGTMAGSGGMEAGILAQGLSTQRGVHLLIQIQVARVKPGNTQKDLGYDRDHMHHKGFYRHPQKTMRRSCRLRRRQEPHPDGGKAVTQMVSSAAFSSISGVIHLRFTVAT